MPFGSITFTDHSCSESLLPWSPGATEVSVGSREVSVGSRRQALREGGLIGAAGASARQCAQWLPTAARDIVVGPSLTCWTLRLRIFASAGPLVQNSYYLDPSGSESLSESII